MDVPRLVEPSHLCTNKCTFVNSRQCKITGNVHRCSQACVVTDTENNYVCMVTGLVFSHLEDKEPQVYFEKKPTGVVINKGRVIGWLKEAIVAFLCDTTTRKALLQSALKRSVVKIKRAMGSTPWSARNLAVAQARVKRQSSYALNTPLKKCDRFVEWLSVCLLRYYYDFATPLFKSTRSGIGTYAAVMISAMASGINDSGNIWIVRRDPLIANHCPSPIDYPKLAAGMTTCKAISNGTFAITNHAMSSNGLARKHSLFRPTAYFL